MAVLDPPIPRLHPPTPVDELDTTREFYSPVIGLQLGRGANRRADWNLHGYQVDFDLAPGRSSSNHSPVAKQLSNSDVEFVTQTCARFDGEVGAQWARSVLDRAGNTLEFKPFADDSQVFAA